MFSKYSVYSTREKTERTDRFASGWCFCSDGYWKTIETKEGLTVDLIEMTIK